MVQLTYDARLKLAGVTAPAAIDFRDTRFFTEHHDSGSSPQLPEPSAVRAVHPGMHSGIVTFEELGLFVKFGQSHKVSIEEAQTMQAIRRAFPDNEIPAPELVGWRSDGTTNFIYMSLVKGSTLEANWPTLTQAEKATITSQLRGMTDLLRSIEHGDSESFIGSVSRTKVQDIYFHSDPGAGPFATVKEFNDRLPSHAWHWLPADQRPFDPYRTLLLDTYKICFTHGDLHLDNILVSGEPGSRSVVAIVDWGMSGWYPEYWEYCKMLLGNDHLPFYEEGWLPTVLEPYDLEFDAVANYWQCLVP